MALRPDSTQLSTSTPEYLAFREYYEILISTVGSEPGAFCDALFGNGLISPDTRNHVRTTTISNVEKARELVDAVIDRISRDPDAFDEFFSILKSPHNAKVANKLEDCYKKKGGRHLLNKPCDDESCPDIESDVLIRQITIPHFMSGSRAISQSIVNSTTASTAPDSVAQIHNESDSDTESVYYTPASSVESLINKMLNDAIRNQDTEGVVSVLTHFNKWNIDLRIWYLRGRQRVVNLKLRTKREFRNVLQIEEKAVLSEISFLELCLKEFHENLTVVTDTTSVQKIAHPRVTLTFEQLYNFNLSEYFVAETKTKTKVLAGKKDESSSPTVYELQNSCYDLFCSCFQKLLDKKYGHLDELDLFGDEKSDDKPGIIASDFEADLKACTQIEHYSLFFATLFSQYESVNELQEHIKQWYEELDSIATVPTHVQLQQEIFRQVSSFCHCLKESRLQTIIAFEQYEQGFFSKLSSSRAGFLSIINSDLNARLSDIALSFEERVNCLIRDVAKSRLDSLRSQETAVENFPRSRICTLLKALVEIHDNCSTATTQEACRVREKILEVETELYKKILEALDINNEIMESAKDYLSLCTGTSHFTYLCKHLSNMEKLLSIVLNPYTVSHERKDMHTIYTVTMVVGSLSGALSAFSGWLDSSDGKYSLKEGDELRLFANTILYLDSDVQHNSMIFHGVSVALISPRLSHEKQGKISINTDGKPLDSIHQVENANSGADGTDSNRNGKPGVDGKNGDCGNAGGHILIIGSSLYPDNFNLSAKGSRGQDGQHGGNGGNGWDPLKEHEGQDGSEPKFELGRWRTEDSVVISYGTYGYNGGQGGNAGMGGAAGKSGISGKIELIDLDDETNCKTTQQAIEDGKPGKPGKPGKGGKHARHGKDWGKCATALEFFREKFGTFCDKTRPDSSIVGIKGELEHSAIEKRTGSGKQIEKIGAKGLPRQRKPENHPDFIDRGSNRDGKAAQVKVNTIIAKENKAIDKNACFMAMISQCRQTGSHWNEKSQFNFLKSFASRIGESYESRYMMPSHGKKTRTGKVVWNDCILKSSGKTEVEVTQTEQATVQVMTDLEEKYVCHTTSYMSGESDVDLKPVYIDLSSFAARAEQKNIRYNVSLPLESILTCDKFDKYIENFTSEMELSTEISVYVVAIDSTKKAEELGLKYDFILINNMSKNSWCLYHTCGRLVTISNSESLIISLNELQLNKDEPKQISSNDSVYEGIIEWLYRAVGTELVLPCTDKQKCCILQLKLLLCLRRSYQAVCKLYDEKSIHHLQSTYEKHLKQLLVSSNSLGALLTVQDILKAHATILMPIDISWLQQNTACSELPATQDLTAAVTLYNKEYTREQLLTVITKFVMYHICCCASNKSADYFQFLDNQATKSALKAFTTELGKTFELLLFGEKKIEVPAEMFTPSKFHNIFQRAYVVTKDDNFDEYLVDLTFISIKEQLKKVTVSTIVDTNLSILLEKMQKQCKISTTTQSQDSLLKRKKNFKIEYKDFCSSPSLEKVSSVLQTYSNSELNYESELECLLKYVFDEVHLSVKNFEQKPDHKFSLDINAAELQCQLKAISEPLPQAQALCNLLEQLHDTALLEPAQVDSKALDTSTLLIDVPAMFKTMFDFYNQLFYIPSKEKEKREVFPLFIQLHTEKIRKLTATLHKYPLLCPSRAILSWGNFVEKKLLATVAKKLKIYQKKQKNQDLDAQDLDKPSNRGFITIMLKNLEELQPALTTCLDYLTILGKCRQNLDLFSFAKDLNMYSSLCTESDQYLQAKKIVKICLGLPESPIEAGYLKPLSEWLQPGLLGFSISKLTIDIKRLSPQQNLLILSQEPRTIPENTIVLLAEDNSTWRTCSRDIHSTTESYQYCDVPAEIISDILGSDIHQKVTSAGKIELTNEHKAEILGKLSLEDEVSVAYSVQFCGHTIIKESSRLEDPIRVDIDLATCSVQLFQREHFSNNMNTDEKSIILTFTHSSHLNDSQLSYLQDWLKQEHIPRQAFLCILKHPSQPVIVKSVTNCGDQETLDFCYSPPLATDVTSSVFIEQIRPITNLLSNYQDLYQNLKYFPQDLLLKKIRDSLTLSIENCRKTFFQADIFCLVQLIRSHFIQSTCKVIDIPSLGNLVVILKITEAFSPSNTQQLKYTFIKKLLLSGLELFVYFALILREQNELSANLSHTKKQTSNVYYRFYQYWKYILEGKHPDPLNKSKAECLLTAFAYIKESQAVDEGLSHESAAVQSRAYSMITEGLQLLQVHTDGEQIKTLLEEASQLAKKCRIKMVRDCSERFDSNGRNLPSLLAMIGSVNPLTKEVIEMKFLSDPNMDEKACCHLLESPLFFADLTATVLVWVANKLYYFCQELLSLPFLSENKKTQEQICTFTSWVMNETRRAFAANDWETFKHHISITEALTLKFQALKNGDPKQLQTHSLVLVIKAITASDDLADISYILENIPYEEWLHNLIASNFLAVLQNYYGVTIEKKLGAQLLGLNTKLLQVFYNVFVSDQYNQPSDFQQKYLLGYVSLEQITAIFNWLSHIANKSCASVYTVLCTTSLALWENELAEIYFKQYIDHWADITEADRQKTVYLINRVRLDTGVHHNDFIALLCIIRRKYLHSALKSTTIFLEMFESLYYGRISLTQVETIVSGYDYMHWSEQLETVQCKAEKDCEPRNVSTVLELIEAQVRSGDYDISMDQFNMIKKEANQVIHMVHQEVNTTAVSQLNEPFFTSLKRNISIKEKVEWLEDKDNRVKFVAHIVIVWILCTSEAGQKQVPYNTQIVSLLLFLHANDKGLLQQVKTGEGKTLIVAMLAAANALLGYHVDIVSSNRDLAQDGMTKCQQFFEHLNLQAAVNCTDDDDTNQQAYKSHIVYGDVGSFQRDVLTEECEPGGTSFSTRYADLSKNCLIVDEVDSMFLDKGKHILYLSHDIGTLKHLETLFITIWSAVLNLKKESDLPIDQAKSQLAQTLCTLIDKRIIIIPEYLMDFCKKKLESWVKSAFQARFMNVDDQFIIDSRNSHVKQILPIDKQTGIEQYNMKWTDGLSQFLELKYQRPLSTESLRAVFISNKRFFKRYGKQLFGLTGTLGSVSSRSLLRNLYDIKYVKLPTNQPKRYSQTKSRVATSDQQWCELVKYEVSSKIREQPVLVICETIRQLNSMKGHLENDPMIKIIDDIQQSDSTLITKLEIQIKDYARDGDDVEKTFSEQGGALPHQLILATNKGGRGTDIKINGEKAPKGLHVILSFLPENVRIEEQAFGRAARAGQAGSGCLIIQINPLEYQKRQERFNTIGTATEIFVEMEKIKRNRAETERLSLLHDEGIPKLDMEENLYLLFQKHQKVFTSALNTVKLFEVHVNGTQHIKQACQTIVKNRWAFWLVSVRNQISSANTTDKRKAIEDEFSKEFPCDREHLSLPSESPDSTFFKMPEDYIQLGHAYLKEIETGGKVAKKLCYKAALTCFERANEKGDMTGYAAMAACVYFVKLNPEPNKDNKKKVLHFLKIARSIMTTLKQGWMANGEGSKALADLVDVSQYIHEGENPYALQIEGKLEVIGIHLHIIETLLGKPLEESSFVNEPTDLKEEDRISEEQSREIYHSLCKRIISHHKVRKCWRRQQEKLEALFKEAVEPTIADGLIKLIFSHEKTSIHEDDLYHLVHSSEELWDIIKPLMRLVQTVKVIKVKQITKEVLGDAELVVKWAAIQNQICAESSECTQCVLTSDRPCYQSLDDTEYSRLTSHLRNNGLCIDTKRGSLKDDASIQIETIDLGKFEECKVQDEAGNLEELSLRKFLAGLISHCITQEGGYLYEYMLPYGTKSQEAKKLHTFLQEQDILKSGQLAVAEHKYDSKNEFESLVEDTLGTEYSEEQRKFILSVLKDLKGEVRKFEHSMQIELVSFNKLKDHPEDIPKELNYFNIWHMDHFLSLDQKEKGRWDRNAFICAMFGIAQVVAGVVLLLQHSTLGWALVTSGIGDVEYATMAGLTGRFSWKDYKICKVFSLITMAATGGQNALATLSQSVPARIGSGTRFSALFKAVTKAAGAFVSKVSPCILSHTAVADVQEHTVNAIVNFIGKKLLSYLKKKIKTSLEQMAKASANDDEFKTRSADMIRDLRDAFGQDRSGVTCTFDQLQLGAISSLTQRCREITERLHDPDIQLAGSSTMLSFVYQQLCESVSVSASITRAAREFKASILKETNSEARLHSMNEHKIDMTTIEDEANKFESIFEEFITKKLQEKVKVAINEAIKMCLNKITTATSRLVRTSVMKAFKGKTTSELVKEIKENNQETGVNLMREHHHQDETQQESSPSSEPPPSDHESSKESKEKAFLKKRDSFKETILEPKRHIVSSATPTAHDSDVQTITGTRAEHYLSSQSSDNKPRLTIRSLKQSDMDLSKENTCIEAY